MSRGGSNFFGDFLGFEGLGWQDFLEALLLPQSHVLHSLHVVLVRLIFCDLPAASDQPFLGRPLNCLTWPELLRQVRRPDRPTAKREPEEMVE